MCRFSSSISFIMHRRCTAKTNIIRYKTNSEGHLSVHVFISASQTNVSPLWQTARSGPAHRLQHPPPSAARPLKTEEHGCQSMFIKWICGIFLLIGSLNTLNCPVACMVPVPCGKADNGPFLCFLVSQWLRVDVMNSFKIRIQELECKWIKTWRRLG